MFCVWTSVNLLFVFKYIYYIDMLFVKVIHICKSNIGEQNPWHGKYRWCCCMKGFQWICAFLSWSKLKLILQEVSYCQLLEPAYTCREIERWKKLKHIALFFRQDKHLCMHSTSFSGSQNKSKKAGGVRKCPSEQVNIESWLWITICDVSRYPVQGQWYWRCNWPEDVDISKVWNAWGRNSHLGSGECVSTLL